MSCKHKYLIVALFSLYSISSYSQRILIEEGHVYVDAFGIDKNILAVTQAQQDKRKNSSDGSTLTANGNINGSINSTISAKFEIHPEEFTVNTWAATIQKCTELLPAQAWRLPTLNEALIMSTFYPQMHEKNNNIFKKNAPDFNKPGNDRNYATATHSGAQFYFFKWSRTEFSINTSNVVYGYYGLSAKSNGNIKVRCIRDVPQ